MAVQQFNGTWIGKEDRVLLRFNTTEGEEYRLWLTRHITRGILDGGRQFLRRRLEQNYQSSQAEAIQSFQEQAVRESTDFSQPFESGRRSPLGDSPLLVIQVVFDTQLRPSAESSEVSVAFDVVGGKRLTVRLPHTAIPPLLLLLEQLQAQAQWALTSPTASDQTTVVPEAIAPPTRGLH